VEAGGSSFSSNFKLKQRGGKEYKKSQLITNNHQSNGGGAKQARKANNRGPNHPSIS
jgi:hypothetical protein